jgi:hypothetical protein
MSAFAPPPDRPGPPPSPKKKSTFTILLALLGGGALLMGIAVVIVVYLVMSSPNGRAIVGMMGQTVKFAAKSQRAAGIPQREATFGEIDSRGVTGQRTRGTKSRLEL